MSPVLFQNFEDWVTMASPSNPRPAYDPGALTPEMLEEIAAYNSRLGPIATHDTKAIAEAISHAQRRNERAVFNGQQCVLVSGRPMDGKTVGVASYALGECRRVWSKTPALAGQTLVAPWGYLEVTEGSGLKAMATSLLSFIGAPVPSRTTASDLMQQLRLLLPQVGMRGVIIDDSHGIAGAKNEASRAFAGALKAMITGLPVTLVIVGVELESSALEGVRGDEVRLRGEKVYTGRWSEPGPKKAGPWGQLVDRLSRLLEIPASPGCGGMRRRDFVTRLAEESDGRPGLAIEWVKEAAEFAVMNGVALDLDTLEATSDYPARRLSTVVPVTAARKRRTG